MKLKAKAKQKLAKQAKEWLDNFGIDWTIYGEPEVQSVSGEDQNHDLWFVTWTNIHGNKICLSNIWIKQDGTILQAGDNHGELTF